MELRPLVLALLEQDPLYGYQLVQRARSEGKLQWEEGTIYPLLHKMEGEGLLASEWRKAPRSRKRKYYSLTPSGKKALAKARAHWKVISRILLEGNHA